VDSARSAGADYVIALSHLGMNEASSPWTAKEVIANTSGINAVIDGNSDSIISGQLIINKLGGLVTLTSAGPDLKAIGELTISASGNISTDIITSYGDEDANVKTLINRYNDQIASQADQTIARSDVKLTIKEADDSTRAIRNQETNLGDLTADAYRALSDADIALIDGASLRSDIAAGDVTYANVIAANPYRYRMSVVKATGQQILDALEVGARSCPAESSGFLQVSGITYEIDTTVDSNVVFDSKNAFLSIDGSRRVVNVRVNGTAISGTKVYTVASTNNLIDGNIDGLTMFKANEKILKDVMLDNQIIISYMRDTLQGVIGSEYAIPQGRITVITAGDKAGILAYKSALARTTKFSSVKVSSRKIYVKLTGNSKAYGFRYQVYTSGGTLVNNKSKTTTSYNTAKKTKGRKYTVKVTPYTYVMGELVYGKTISKTVTIK
ncbi:MAG TPA: bifunctional metallophosphatase/5'-nucleotidase, partial [Anaerovoracaceae bacterium]|nr:bifunctional metallophosphatase/5'-nucleotidase [Anaerovoracaceae bacterium]